jgi:hypothetical protein
MITTSKPRRIAATALALPLLAGGLVVANTQTASAACAHPAWQNRSSGAGKMKSTSPIRSGPAEGCSVTKSVGTSTDLFYHCWVQNTAGNKWTHVRIASGTTEGWVYNGNLNDGGLSSSGTRCLV